MTIRFRCYNCCHALTADDRHAGTRFKCPKCGALELVPQPGKKGPSEPAVSEEPPVEPVKLQMKRDSGEELDMTPMVDVTFLLLIFFMITAAFTLQKSIEVPPPDRDEASAQARTIEEFETDDDYVIIRIAPDNTVWVDEREAPSEQEVLVQLREAREGRSSGGGKGPSRLLVLADREARHETVVMALDAGNAVGMESVRLATVDEQEL